VSLNLKIETRNSKTRNSQPVVASSPIRVPAHCFHASWRSKGPCWMNAKIDEIGDILQLANGLNGPNRLNLTKVGLSARISGFELRLKLAANGI
jgi:hypothetical protein